MFRKLTRSRIPAALFALFALAVLSATALAHERREVGSSTLVVGFLTEPAFESQANAASVRITSTGSGESITGLEETLEIEITHQATGESVVTELDTRFGDPGHYVFHFVPTAPGQYEFRVFGEINEESVDETFVSGPGTFSNVEPLADIQFPLKLASAREVENAARGAQESADQALVDSDNAGSTASTALVFAIVGASAGLAGAGLGIAAFQAARKR
jgi:hypothetical protein